MSMPATGLAPAGAFVLGASNAVFRERPIQHYRAMVQAWRDYSRPE